MKASEALPEIKRMLGAFRAFENAQKVVELLANAEQVQGELDKANAAARVELNSMAEKIDAANAQVAAAKAEAKSVIDAAKAKAVTLAAKAETEAEAMRAAAKAEFDETQVLLTKMRDEAADAAGAADKSRAEVAALEKRLAEVKGKLQAFLGA